MGFNYIEYVKRGSNPLLKEEQNPIKPPTSKSGLEIWIKKKYNISEDDIATFFEMHPKAIEDGEFRTVEAIEAALKRTGIEFKSILNTSPADNTATDNDTQDLKATNHLSRKNNVQKLMQEKFCHLDVFPLDKSEVCPFHWQIGFWP